MADDEGFFKEIIEAIISGKVSDSQALQRIKVKLCSKYKLDSLPSNADILARSGSKWDEVEPLLRKKPMRTASGVSPVAVMTEPSPCPHGTCIYCPGGVEHGTPQSYTGREPAALRASHNRFDPYDQTRSRLEQLHSIGHPTDKIDLIIMGGTFPAQPEKYQSWFVGECFNALNRAPRGSPNEERLTMDLEPIHEQNESAPHRCIGMTIETRPDWCKEEHIDRMLEQGGTRVELGVQTFSDEVLKEIERGHKVEDTIEATQLLRDAGLKVGYHLMPGLPLMSREKELDDFKRAFRDPDFKPDMLKIYPTLLIEGTVLFQLWKEGKYSPLETEEAVEMIGELKADLPPWVRIHRIQRDIPSPLISGGIASSNLRQLVHDWMRENDKICRCIRCREVGLRTLKGAPPTYDDIQMIREDYEAANGKEVFLSFEDRTTDSIISYLRLRLPSSKAHRKEVREMPCAMVREVKVIGPEVPFGKTVKDGWQHRGYGKELLEEAEEIARGEFDARRVLVNSGVGVRDYYRRTGYERVGPYMGKDL